MSRISSFRERLRVRHRILGTFVKTPNAAIIEVMGYSPLDCVCLDAEHAPFDRTALDAAIFAARAADMPSLVRVSRMDTADILSTLDLGATGVVVPHVSSQQTALAAAAACRYGPLGRGYAGSTRAAGYGTRSMAENIAKANAEVTLIAQIEDADALDEIDSIAAVDGIDALFIGRMDLTVSMGADSPNHPSVVDAVRTICAAAKRHGRCVGMFTATTIEALQWCDAGASFFLLSSDQQMMLQGAKRLREEFDQ